MGGNVQKLQVTIHRCTRKPSLAIEHLDFIQSIYIVQCVIVRMKIHPLRLQQNIFEVKMICAVGYNTKHNITGHTRLITGILMLQTTSQKVSRGELFEIYTG